MRPAAVALLAMVVLGTVLYVQHTVQAQEEGGPSRAYMCSTCGHLLESAVSVADDLLAHDNVFTIDLGRDAGGALVELENLSLPRIVERVDGTPNNADDQDTSVFDGPNANPKVIQLNGNGRAIIVAVHKSAGLRDGRAALDEHGVPVATLGGGDDDRYEVKAFHGNRIRVRHLVSGLPHDDYVTIDNLPPELAVYAPQLPLYAKSGVTIAFTFEFLDVDSGFTNDDVEIASSEVTAARRFVPPEEDDVRLVVAGHAVELEERHFTKTDAGWRVKRTLSSTTLQNVAAYVPWYVEVADRANNKRRMAGRIDGTTAAGGTDRSVVIDIFRSRLQEDAFVGTEIQVTYEGVTSEPQPIAAFTPATGSFAVAGPFFADARPIGAGASYAILGAGLIAVDGDEARSIRCRDRHGLRHGRQTRAHRPRGEGQSDVPQGGVHRRRPGRRPRAGHRSGPCQRHPLGIHADREHRCLHAGGRQRRLPHPTRAPGPRGRTGGHRPRGDDPRPVGQRC